MQTIAGIYKIQNNFNQKLYIGQSKNIYYRWYTHRSELNNKKHHCKKLQQDWNYFSEDAFSFLILEEVPKNYLLIKEKEYLSQYSKDKLYNFDIETHPWKTDIMKVFRSNYRVDSDGIALPLTYCPCCGLEKLSNSFIHDSLYCLECRNTLESELLLEDETLDGFRMPIYETPVIKYKLNRNGS